MVASRVIAGTLAGALFAAGIAVAPAIGAPEIGSHPAKKVSALRVAGSFTPSSADPRLAALYARGGIDGGAFHFTPSETRRNDRAITVAVRARSNNAAQVASTTPATVGLAPIAYNLGVAVGWKRFAVSGDVAKVDLASQPGGRESADVAVSYSLDRFTTRVKGSADRALPGAPKLVEEAPSYSLDLGGAYSLTRNIDLTAGVRYKSERERLVQVADDRRDSQAVYVGTAFRF